MVAGRWKRTTKNTKSTKICIASASLRRLIVTLAGPAASTNFVFFVSWWLVLSGAGRGGSLGRRG
jgi:hypothetical protein